jgi:hypothetical protein
MDEHAVSEAVRRAVEPLRALLAQLEQRVQELEEGGDPKTYRVCTRTRIWLERRREVVN